MKTLTALLLAAFSLQAADLHADETLGRFNLERDLYLPQFDSKTDVDDIHSVAAVATLLNDARFASVNFHAVAGAYGIQEGLYVPANELFELAFGDRWSDAHADRSKALHEVNARALATLQSGGSVWIAEAGQSDFSAALVRALQKKVPANALQKRVHIVQHSDWNEQVTSPDALAFVNQAASYHKIADGNAENNGTPGFRSEAVVDWRASIKDPRLVNIWTMAVDIANTYNGSEGRYLNEAIEMGGLDFSDTTESAWIFGFDDLVDANDFFEMFAQ